MDNTYLLGPYIDDEVDDNDATDANDAHDQWKLLLKVHSNLQGNILPVISTSQHSIHVCALVRSASPPSPLPPPSPLKISTLKGPPTI